jgi:hypothetical protein
MKDVVASVRFCTQIGPEDWVMETKVKIFNPTSTLNDINEWVTSLEKRLTFSDVTLTETEP